MTIRDRALRSLGFRLTAIRAFPVACTAQRPQTLPDALRHQARAKPRVSSAPTVADRVTFIVDPNNEIQFVSAAAGSVGRNVDGAVRDRSPTGCAQLAQGRPDAEQLTNSSENFG